MTGVRGGREGELAAAYRRTGGRSTDAPPSPPN